MLRKPHKASDKEAHHETITALESAAALGCFICAAVLDEVQRISGPDYDHHGYDKPLLKYNFFRPWGYNITGMDFRLDCKFSLIPLPQNLLRLSQCHGAAPEPDTSSISFNYRLPPDTSDPAVAELALFWLEKCLKNHGKCGRSQDPNFFPLRLLDVSGNEPRLVLTDLEKPDGPYATLSHCWGPNPTFFRLTDSHVKEMRAGISIERLPQNFRSAIQTCRSLGVKYLWIDSLCIIQSGKGSREDWLLHLSAMQAVYANCLINIASARASNANESCYTSRNLEHVEACIVPFSTYHSGFENPGPRLLIYEELFVTGRQLTPLGSRGWVVQERILSPRVLHFAAKQVFWECSESQNECEAYPAGLDHKFRPCGPFELPTRGSPPSENDHILWQQLIWTYTACSLSRPETDKLGAFSSIAEHMASIFKDDYIAGHFRSELPEALLWSISRGSTPSAPPGFSNSYRAPSWSWANTDVQIQPYAMYKGTYNLDGSEPSFLLNILGFRIDLLDSRNAFGPLQHAELILSAKMAQLVWDNTIPLKKTEFVMPKLGYSFCSTFFYFDNEAAFFSDQRGVMVLVVAGYEGWCIDVLIVNATESEGTGIYRRLGMARIYHREIMARFASIDERNIVLV